MYNYDNYDIGLLNTQSVTFFFQTTLLTLEGCVLIHDSKIYMFTIKSIPIKNVVLC